MQAMLKLNVYSISYINSHLQNYQDIMFFLCKGWRIRQQTELNLSLYGSHSVHIFLWSWIMHYSISPFLIQKWLEDSVKKVAKEWNELSKKEKTVSVQLSILGQYCSSANVGLKSHWQRFSSIYHLFHTSQKLTLFSDFSVANCYPYQWITRKALYTA